MINKWLKQACETTSVIFIGNFDIFREKGGFFKIDVVCLNKPVARQLTSYLLHSVNSPQAVLTFSKVHGETTTVRLPQAA